jgi:hypothetical protein
VTNGVKSSPRGLETVGLFDQSFSFSPGEVFVRPKANLNIGFIEMLQFITGTFDIRPFEIIAPNARLDLFTNQSAYGPRTVEQLPRVIDELRRDHYSRRAVMMIAHPTDTPETMPCTISMQFQLNARRGTPLLFTIITMRSSDLIWGLPTDIIQFGGIAMVVANCLGAVPFECVINAGNAHVYEETKLKPTEQYRLGGHFTLPEYMSLEDYKRWANTCLSKIVEGFRPLELIDYRKIAREREESF